jgi:3-hydroxypropanoate dehydrogenase
MPIDDTALDALFRETRTIWDYADREVTDEELQALYDLVKMGPTSANSSPARFVFVRSAEGREKLKPALSAGNLDKSMAAPVVVIIAQDPLFYHKLPTLFPHADAKSWFSGNPDLAEETAFRNSTLQGAYLMMAARALGYDSGAMSGFDRAKIDRAFFAQNGWKSNFLLSLGHSKGAEAAFPRLPRLDFAEATLFA